MTPFESERGDLPGKGSRSHRLFWCVIAGSALVIVIALLLRRTGGTTSRNAGSPDAKAGARSEIPADQPRVPRALRNRRAPEPKKTAEEIVAGKVRLFGQHRRAIAERIAKRLNKDLPPEIDAFFKAVDKGDWAEIDSRWKELLAHSPQYSSNGDRPDLNPYWATVLDAYGAAEQAHNWPEQQLLDYGNAVLSSLEPGTVYVGGTDFGRWVPELMNETSDDPHIIVTQNALADGGYLDLVREMYGDQFNTLTSEDSQKAFQDYMADARKRLQHDQDFPDEPKQVLPGENITMMDGKVQVSGQVAVMQINEKLLEMLAQKNPDLPFAMEESFPLKGTYADALPLGPLMELNVGSDGNAFNTDLAAQSVDYWRSTVQTLLADPEASGSTYTMNAYSHDVDSTANLLAAHNFTDEAEQAYALASQISPENPQPVSGLAKLLAQTGHADQAQALLNQFAAKYPDQQKAIEQTRAAITWTAQAPAH